MEEAAGYLPENIRLRNAFNNSPSQLRGERELSRAAATLIPQQLRNQSWRQQSCVPF
jgi:hypothetical protein